MLFIFDMGGVVCNTWTSQGICRFLKISDSQFSQINHYGQSNIFSELTTGKISGDEYWKQFKMRASNLQIILPDFDYDIFTSFFHPKLNLQTVKIINKLKKKHRVVCGTNTIPAHYMNHIERADYSLFDQTYASQILKAKKPDKIFWQKILDAEGAYMSDVYFIDDRIENVDAAAQMGMNAIHFTDAKDLKCRLKKFF